MHFRNYTLEFRLQEHWQGTQSLVKVKPRKRKEYLSATTLVAKDHQLPPCCAWSSISPMETSNFKSRRCLHSHPPGEGNSHIFFVRGSSEPRHGLGPSKRIHEGSPDKGWRRPRLNMFTELQAFFIQPRTVLLSQAYLTCGSIPLCYTYDIALSVLVTHTAPPISAGRNQHGFLQQSLFEPITVYMSCVWGVCVCVCVCVSICM